MHEGYINQLIMRCDFAKLQCFIYSYRNHSHIDYTIVIRIQMSYILYISIIMKYYNMIEN